MIRILRRVAWRIARLVAAFVVVWAAGVALERLRAWWSQPTGHLLRVTLSPEEVAALRTAGRRGGRSGLDLEEAWSAHDALQGRTNRIGMVRLTVPPAR